MGQKIENKGQSFQTIHVSIVRKIRSPKSFQNNSGSSSNPNLQPDTHIYIYISLIIIIEKK